MHENDSENCIRATINKFVRNKQSQILITVQFLPLFSSFTKKILTKSQVDRVGNSTKTQLIRLSWP